jgi:hypothetical protein
MNCKYYLVSPVKSCFLTGGGKNPNSLAISDFSEGELVFLAAKSPLQQIAVVVGQYLFIISRGINEKVTDAMERGFLYLSLTASRQFVGVHDH